MPEFISSYLGHIPYLISQDTYPFAQYSAKDNQYHDDTCKSNRNSAFLGTSQLLDAVCTCVTGSSPSTCPFSLFSSIAGTHGTAVVIPDYSPRRAVIQSTLLSYSLFSLGTSLSRHFISLPGYVCHLLNYGPSVDVLVTMAGVYENNDCTLISATRVF